MPSYALAVEGSLGSAQVHLVRLFKVLAGAMGQIVDLSRCPQRQRRITSRSGKAQPGSTSCIRKQHGTLRKSLHFGSLFPKMWQEMKTKQVDIVKPPKTSKTGPRFRWCSTTATWTVFRFYHMQHLFVQNPRVGEQPVVSIKNVHKSLQNKYVTKTLIGHWRIYNFLTLVYTGMHLVT